MNILLREIEQAYSEMYENVHAGVEQDDYTKAEILSKEEVQQRVFQRLENYNLELNKLYIWPSDAFSAECGITLEDLIKFVMEPSDFMMNYMTELPKDNEGNFIFKVVKTSY